MKFDTIFFIGPQGSGKGTQAKLLANRLGFFYWEMGGILREIANDGSELGFKVKSLIDEGVLLKDDLLLEVVKKKLTVIPNDQGVIFDGVPRRLGQANFLLNHLKSLGRKNFVTIFIDIPSQESLNRLLTRAQKQHRADDTEEKIKFRLKQYEQDTIPVLDFLKVNSTFFEINGLPAIEQVTQNINQVLGL